mgnify:FL=1
MISAIFEGLLFGFILSINIGPVFFLLVETSIKKGVRDAFIMNTGVIISDLLWIILLYFGIETFLESFFDSTSSKVIGGVMFILFGVGGLFYIKKDPKVISVGKNRRILFTKGFLLNLVNPSVALFWLATIAFAIKSLDNDKHKLILFFVSVFSIIIIIDTIKFFMARKLRLYLNERRQKKFSKITNLIMILFGLFLIVSNFLSHL